MEEIAFKAIISFYKLHLFYICALLNTVYYVLFAHFHDMVLLHEGIGKGGLIEIRRNGVNLVSNNRKVVKEAIIKDV